MGDIRVNSLAIPLMPSLVHMLDYQRIGEVAGRSLFPCLLQVDAVASVWLCSPLGPRKTPYICARVRVSPATYPSTPFSIPPVKPCRRRRHFSPQTRMNRFVFLNLPILSLGNHLGVTVSPQSPLPAGYVTLPVDSRSPPLGLMLPHSRKQARQIPPFSKRSQQNPPPFLGARRTVGDVHSPSLVRTRDLHAAQQIRISAKREAMGRAAEVVAPSSSLRTDGGCPVAQVNDLSRSLTAFDPISTLVVVVEMSKASWLVSGVVPGVERQPLKKLEPDATALLRLIERWRNE